MREFLAGEFAARPPSTGTIVKFPEGPSWVRDHTDAALDLVSEAAAAIKGAEQRAAETVERAENLANAAIGKLHLAEARIQRAEQAQRKAEAEAAEFAAALAEARESIEQVQHKADADAAEFAAALAELRNRLEQEQARLSVRDADLASAEQRASIAERRAEDAEAAIERIVQAIRNQLPLPTPGAPARKASNVA